MREVGALRSLLYNERGVALPMALFSLLLLTSLSIAFLTLGQTEPVISNNHLRTSQARAMAEAGVERVIWALSNTSTTGVSEPAANTVWGSPYDGTKWFRVSDRGGFVAWVKGGQTDNYQMVVQSVGRIATNSPADGSTYSSSSTDLTSAHRIKVTVTRFPEFGLNAPCALCVNGDLVVKGNATISSTADTSCGNKYGVGVTSGSSLCIGGDNACSESDAQWGNTGSVNGATGSSASANDSTDYTRSASMTNMSLSTSQMDALRQMAKSQGTYYQTGTTSKCGDGASGTQDCTPCSGGTCSFSAANTVPSNGKSIVFVDGNFDTSGNPYQNDAFTGWIIVNGSSTINGNGTINGLLYAVNDISSSSGTNTINGLVVSANTTNASGIDSTAGGTMNINFNCANASGQNNFAKKWFPVPGTWREKTGRAVDASDYP